MHAATLRAMFETVLPAEVIREAVVRLGVQKRRRDLDPVALIYSLVLQGGTWECGRIASAVRDYFERGGTRVVAGAYYKWFDEELLATVRELSARALRYAEAMPKHLPGILAGQRDWRAVDSTVVKLRPEVAATWPGCGEYAALKVHKVYSIGAENVVDYSITPARRHDGPELVIDEAWRGMGLVADLGYNGFGLVRACSEHNVKFVLRRKEGWSIYLDEQATAATRQTWVGVDPATIEAGAEFKLDASGPVDIDVTFGAEADPVPVRLVGLPMEQEYSYFLTNLPRSSHTPAEVAMLYRLRWSIEIDNKLAKTGCQLDEITAERPVSVEILAHVAMIASVLANCIVHLDHLEQGAVGAKTVRFTRPPLHPILLWKCLVTGSHRLAEMLAQAETPLASWERVAANLTAGAADRNWKRAPSPMDRVKGRTAGGRAWSGGRPRESARSGPK
jgi:hypothetical protein